MPRPNRGPRLVRLKKRGWQRGVYYIRWTEGGHTLERSTGESDVERAQEAFVTFLVDHGAGRRAGTRGPHQTLIADALADYAREHAPHTASPERIAYAVDRLIEFWGASTVDAIRPKTCKRYRTARGVSDGTVRRELGVLRAAVNHAVKEGRLTAAPFVWLPPSPPGRDRWLTRAEAAALLNAARCEPAVRLYLPLFILIGLYTAARKGAILSLRWSQVDLVRGRIDFNAPGRRQTAKRRPVIPIPRRLAWFLRKAQERAASPYVIHRDRRRLGKSKTVDAARPFQLDRGPVQDVKKGFAAACDRAGLAGVSPHTLRHTAGTWLAQAGVSLWEIGGYLGHSYERTTELYGHHHPDYLKGARAALDR